MITESPESTARAPTWLDRRHPAEPELLDRPGLSAAQVERALRGLSRVNRLLLGYRPLMRTVLPRILAGPPVQRLVDLGTGSGEGGARLARAAAKRGVTVSVVGIDCKLAHLVAGRRFGHGQHRVVADAGALPLAAGSADWAASSLFFHHFDADGNRRVLAEMRRVARRGAAVVDLRPGRLPYWLARLLIPLVGGCPVTRHDGPASVARAWPIEAVRRLTADLPVAELRKRFPFRWSLVVENLNDRLAAARAGGERTSPQGSRRP